MWTLRELVSLKLGYMWLTPDGDVAGTGHQVRPGNYLPGAPATPTS